MATNLYVENYQPEIKWARKVESKLGGSFGGSLTVTGNVTSLSQVIDETANATLTQAQSGSVVLLDVASGATITLPAPAVGIVYTFAVVTTVTSNAYKIITNAGTVLLAGSLLAASNNLASKSFLGDGSSHVSINMAAASSNATGGIIGSVFQLLCLTTTLWAVDGSNISSATPTTPFGTS